jgi:hypothetical protein
MNKGEQRFSATRIVQKQAGQSVQTLTTEICVVGAGIAGISAALEAARLGRQVVLVDSLPALGGQAVNSNIGIFCGLFSNGQEHCYQLTYGIAQDILIHLTASGNIHFVWKGANVALYEEIALSRWIENAVYEAGIKVILGAVLRGVNREGRKIVSLEISTRYGDLRLHADGFVEASGDAALAWQAGLPCRMPAEGTVYGSQMIVMEGVDEAHYPEPGEISRRVKEKGDEYGLVRKDGFAFHFPGKGIAHANMTHTQTPLDPVEASVQALEGKKQADRTLAFLQNEFPLAFGKARIRSYGLPGIRQTRWIVGRHHLTADEVRSGIRFDDAVARTSWPIELHYKPEGYYWEPFDDNHVHYIPLGSLTPPDVDNLVAAGRCIDGDVAALSSVRVMGPCMAMGMAAAHTLDLAGRGSVHEIDIHQLQLRLKDNLDRTDNQWVNFKLEDRVKGENR